MTSVVSPDQLLQQLHWRYATKKFEPTKKIPQEVWEALEKSLVLAPSSFGLQPWKFFVDPFRSSELNSLSSKPKATAVPAAELHADVGPPYKLSFF